MRLARFEIVAEARRILALAWPVMLTSLNWTLMHLIDVAVVGRAGTAQLGALAAGRTLTFITIVMGLSALSGVLVFAARADGADNREAAGDQLRSGILLGLALGLPCMIVLLLWAEPLLTLIGVPSDLAGGGAAVTRAMALAYPFQFVQVAASYFLEGISRPRRVMVVNIATLPLNAVLAWAWVGGHLGLPAMGAVGAVLATAVVSAIGMIGILVAIRTLPEAADYQVRAQRAADWLRALRDLPGLFRFGAAPALAAGLEFGGFAWLIVLSTQLGPVTAAAFQTVFSLHNLIFAIALGFGSATGVRVGNAVGAGDRAAMLPRCLIAAALAILTVGSAGLLFGLEVHRVLQPFSRDAAVLAVAGGLFGVMAPFMWLDAIQLVFVYALRSAGDQIAAGINGVIAFFVISGGLGTLLVRLGFGASALAYAFVAGMAAAAFLQGTRMVWISGRAARLPG